MMLMARDGGYCVLRWLMAMVRNDASRDNDGDDDANNDEVDNDGAVTMLAMLMVMFAMMLM